MTARTSSSRTTVGTTPHGRPIHERFHVYVDGEGVLRTDHELRMWAATVVRLHYKLTRI